MGDKQAYAEHKEVPYSTTESGMMEQRNMYNIQILYMMVALQDQDWYKLVE